MNRRFVPAAAAVFGLLALAAPAVHARRQQQPFSDVPANHWAAESVAKLAARGIVTGYPAAQAGGGAAAPRPATAYNGSKPVTRYELAVTLYRFVQYLERADQQKKGGLRVQVLPPIKNTDGAAAVRTLVAGGYLAADTPLGKNGATVATANQLADALAQVIRRDREKRTPVSPDSLHAPKIGDPPAHGGSRIDR
jgi:hypothetical protein